MNVEAWAENLPEWLSPRAWTERQIGRTRVPDAVFDVGAGGLAARYNAMWSQYQAAVRLGVSSITSLFMLCAASQLVAWLEGYFDFGPRWIPSAISVAAFTFSLWLLLKGLWQIGAAEAYAREWKKLEAVGPKWQLWNGSLFRVVFERRDGSLKIDPRTRQQRLDEEIQAVRGREAHIVSAAKTLAITLGGALVLYALCAVPALYLQWSILTDWNFAGLLTCWFLSNNLSRPLYDLIHGVMERHYYNAGCQYIPAPKTLDPVHEPLTRETVQKQKAHGDGRFIDPYDASDRLGA